MKLAEGRDVVEAGIGAGIRDHDETVPHQNSAAIGHSRSPNAPDFFGARLVANFRGASNPNSPWRGMRRAGKTCPTGRRARHAESSSDKRDYGDVPLPWLHPCASRTLGRRNGGL